jgi:phosphonate transport system substrate-binding protein
MSSSVIRLGSCMAPNMDHIMEAVAAWLSEDTGLEIVFQRDPDWQSQERRFDQGELDVVWICGLPYVWKADDPELEIELLAAPVMKGGRYRSRPIYYSDVIVRADSAYRSFADLRGASWSYNEPGSHSGYNVVRAHLADMGEDWSYFAQVVEAGSHQRSLELVLEGRVAASAVDSTVLDEEVRRGAPLHSQLRALEVLGPSPIPPLIIHRSVPESRRRQLRSALISLNAPSSPRRPMLESVGLQGFTSVTDEDYVPIREMDQKASSVRPPTEIVRFG